MILVWIVTSLVVFSLLKLLVTSLPSGVVERLFSRYAVHAKVTSDQTTIMFEDRPLNDQQVSEIIRHFNDAIFIERYYIYPGVMKSVFFIRRKGLRRLPCKQSLANMM
ncbi:YfmQ family protein [Bacillus sp. RP12]|nr:YfmQ family protein [Bacillus sp. RP12]